MIDLDREKPVTLDEAVKLIPTVNTLPGMTPRKAVHVRTLYNWTRRGKKGVVLETVLIGSVLVTTKEALQRFYDALGEARLRKVDEQRRRNDQRRPLSSRRANKAHRDAMERLRKNHGL